MTLMDIGTDLGAGDSMAMRQDLPIDGCFPRCWKRCWRNSNPSEPWRGKVMERAQGNGGENGNGRHKPALHSVIFG